MVNIKDVAKRAQVSTATVSYVINKKEKVSDELTTKVNQAIKDLNYHPSRIARSLRKGKTMTIGLIMDDISNQFGAEFTRGLMSAARKKDYNVIILNLNRKGAEERNFLDQLLSQQVDGIIYSGYGTAEDKLLEIEQEGIPIIAVDKPLKSDQISSILIDNRQSVVAVVEYLVKLGHKNICYIAGLPDNPNTLIRAQAFLDGLEQQGIKSSNQSVIYGDYSLFHGYQTIIEMKDLKKYNAFFCADDMVAFGAMSALKQKGIKIPEEVAVIGFDNVPLASFFDPSLTTINYPMQEMGRKSFELFYKRIKEKNKVTEHILLPTKIIVRKSTNPFFALETDFSQEKVKE
jgi:LacI family transcriptional regulator